jgi:hypothetical protein
VPVVQPAVTVVQPAVTVVRLAVTVVRQAHQPLVEVHQPLVEVHQPSAGKAVGEPVEPVEGTAVSNWRSLRQAVLREKTRKTQHKTEANDDR